MKLVLSVTLLLMCTTVSSQSNCWRGITPLHSTCEDIKNILKVDTCSAPISDYTIPDYRVKVFFATADCSLPHAYRVPKGTVVSIAISPENQMAPSEFGIDLTKYKKRDVVEIVGLEYYDSEEEGVTVDLYQGFVQNLFLYPRKSDDALRCKPASK